ncbi:MAG: hypothetical protein ACO1O1_02255 [Adhaeribacter sp.]
MKNTGLTLLLLFVLCLPGALAQSPAPQPLFKEVVLKVDTAAYSITKDQIPFNGESHLSFQYHRETEVCEVNLYPISFQNIHHLRLARSADFDLLDSVVNVNNDFFRFKVRFKDLTGSQFLNFTFHARDTVAHTTRTEVVKLLPYTRTTLRFYPDTEEMFVGEEKVFELVSNNPRNVKLVPDWVRGGEIDYRISELNGVLRLHLMPRDLGRKTLRISPQTVKPFLDKNRQLTYQLPFIEKRFEIKGSRLTFLSLDKKEVTLDDAGRQKGIEVMLDNNWAIQLQKTYRIEAQEAPGGALVAELFTRSTLTNNRVLCWLRVFNYHRLSEGYLYIKDGDEAKFITNFSITPKTTIRSVSIMHEGGDWTSNLSVNPGETIHLKIEGEGLHKARFHFDDLTDITSDSSLRTEETSLYKLQVPLHIQRKRIGIYNRAVNTGFSLTIKEFQRARPFDFITLSYGDTPRKVSALPEGPLFYNHTIRDVVFAFNPNLLDNGTKLYGKQYLDFEIRITNSRNELIDQRTVEDVLICPGENSPRHAYYADKACFHGNLSLNNIIGRKTYDLDDWSRILITVRHDKDKHGDEAISKKIDLILRKETRFDVDVSFPGGLLIKRLNDPSNKGYGEFGGISMAMIAQLSFYHPEKIARFRPYKVGVGFLALNAFNFNANADRDVGVVVLGSLYPTQKDVKLTFPLFLGGGYFLNDQKWFYLLGPGIRLKL